MSGDPSSGAIRLIRLATIACSICAGIVVYASALPTVAALTMRLDESRAILRSDDFVLASLGRTRTERDRLQNRYAGLLRGDVEATFLHDLDADARRHGTSIVSTVTDRNALRDRDVAGETPLTRTNFTVELRGTYRSVLATLVDLSMGNEIVQVRSADLHRADSDLSARIPISLFEPAATSAQPISMPFPDEAR